MQLSEGIAFFASDHYISLLIKHP